MIDAENLKFKRKYALIGDEFMKADIIFNDLTAAEKQEIFNEWKQTPENKPLSNLKSFPVLILEHNSGPDFIIKLMPEVRVMDGEEVCMTCV